MPRDLTRTQFVATTRQWTGSPIHRAYVINRETGKVIATCMHAHTTRRVPTYIPGEVFAKRCAAKMLRAAIAKAEGEPDAS